MNLDSVMLVLAGKLTNKTGLSMTYATVEFKPSQIRHVPDMLANGELEDQSLNDKKLRWYHHHDPKKPRVMNDVSCMRSFNDTQL